MLARHATKSLIIVFLAVNLRSVKKKIMFKSKPEKYIVCLPLAANAHLIARNTSVGKVHRHITYICTINK